MEFKTVVFKKLKKRFTDMKIVPINHDNFDISHHFVPRNPEPIYATIKWPSFDDGLGIFSSIATELFTSVRMEIDENLKLPVEDSKKLSYLKDVNDFCLSIDSKIYEDENGDLHTTLFNIDYSEYENELENPTSTVQGFIQEVRENVRNLIIKINELSKPLQAEVTSNFQNIGSPDQPDKLILIKQPGNVSDNKIKDLYYSLLKFGFISDKTSKKTFQNHFFGKKDEAPIIWINTKGSLKLFIDKIEGNLIKDLGRNKWKLYCRIFHDKSPGIQFQLTSLRGAQVEDISKLTLDKLNQVLSILNRD